MNTPPSTLLLIPPLTQLNTPYPSTSYLTGFLRSQDYPAFQADLGIEMVLTLYSREGLSLVFEELRALGCDLPGEARQMLALAPAYLDTIDAAVSFLQGKDPVLAPRICQRTLLPEGPRFSMALASSRTDRTLSMGDRAKHLATLYLEDLADLLRQTIAPQFTLSRYAEEVGTSASSFDQVRSALAKDPSLTDRLMLQALERHISNHPPDLVGLTIPFAGNLYGAFRIAQSIKTRWPEMKIVLGGGYVNTELRRMTDPRVFEYVDFVTLDDGERPLLCLLEHVAGIRTDADLCRTFIRTPEGVRYRDHAGEKDFRMGDIGTPTYEGLPLDRYLSILDTTNPMHRLWSDGHWNKLTVAHGCYWKKCTFCDVGLDYIGRYETTPDDVLLDRIETLIRETGRRGFHFVDEAAPPAALASLALGLLERKLSIAWWGNIRFEKSFTADLCRLLAASGCIAVSAGLEVASDRLLEKMKKGITVDQTARVAAAFRGAGTMVHAYLMYGFPGETLQEAVESLERVRQLFARDLIQSAFWHKFVATAHSPIGLHPAAHGINLLGPPFAGFAENDLVHQDVGGECPNWLGAGLKRALSHFLEQEGFRSDVRRWFDHKVPAPRVSRSWAKQASSRPVEDKGGNLHGRVVWIGADPVVERHDARLVRVVLPNRIEDVVVSLPAEQADWLLSLLSDSTPARKSPPASYPTWRTVRKTYPFGGPAQFDRWTGTSAWRRIRRAGLLVV